MKEDKKDNRINILRRKTCVVAKRAEAFELATSSYKGTRDRDHCRKAVFSRGVQKVLKLRYSEMGFPAF